MALWIDEWNLRHSSNSTVVTQPRPGPAETVIERRVRSVSAPDTEWLGRTLWITYEQRAGEEWRVTGVVARTGADVAVVLQEVSDNRASSEMPEWLARFIEENWPHD